MSTEHSNTSSGIVIIGAGLAGWHVIDAIRSKDQDIPITLITADNGDRYHKPMLTMAISQNKSATDLVRAKGDEAAKVAGITLLTNTSVNDIDAAGQQLQLISALRSDPANTSYATISYDKLVLAMGAHPIFPKSLPQDLVWHVNHIERFGQLQEKLATGSQRIAIVGAGMVGTEIAEDLLKAGHKITLIDLNDAPLAQMLPAKATARIAKAVESQGIRFLGGCMVSAVKRNSDGTLQVDYELLESSSDSKEADSTDLDSTESADENTASPEPLIVDHVIASTGLVVNETLPTAAGIEFNRRTGIVVDSQTLQTDTANIYAIGDCMSIDGVACRYVAPLRAQATTIAAGVLGLENESYEHKPPMIRLKNKAISVMVTGVPKAEGNWQIKTDSVDELVMELLDDNNEVSAVATIKAPATAK